jgi:hypothetical protein
MNRVNSEPHGFQPRKGRRSSCHWREPVDQSFFFFFLAPEGGDNPARLISAAEECRPLRGLLKI